MFGFILFYFYWIFSIANKAINSWIKDNKLTLVNKQFRMFKTGPYMMTRNRPVYKIIVQDPTGLQRTCWVRCNSFLGFDPKQIEVRCAD
jgi:hypothetical protein